jgi:multisubunit Na+/H+ antiporter MnhF subunit
VVAAIAVLFDAIQQRPATRLHLIGIGLIIVTVGIAFLAAIGRVDIEQEVKLPVRYSVLVALLHVGLLALALPCLARLATTPQRRIGLLGAGTVLAGMLLVLQIVSGRYAIIDSGLLTNAIAHFEQTGQNEPGMERLFPNPVQAVRVLTEMRSGVR